MFPKSIKLALYGAVSHAKKITEKNGKRIDRCTRNDLRTDHHYSFDFFWTTSRKTNISVFCCSFHSSTDYTLMYLTRIYKIIMVFRRCSSFFSLLSIVQYLEKYHMILASFFSLARAHAHMHFIHFLRSYSIKIWIACVEVKHWKSDFFFCFVFYLQFRF